MIMGNLFWEQCSGTSESLLLKEDLVYFLKTIFSIGSGGASAFGKYHQWLFRDFNPVFDY